MKTSIRTVLIGALFILAARPAHAQQWKDIGKTSSGNVVSIDPKSVKHDRDIISATVRVVFTPPVKAARGTWASSKVYAMFDCTKKKIAAKKNVYFSDVNGTKEVERSVNGKPGFGPALNGSLGAIALDYVCAPKKP